MVLMLFSLLSEDLWIVLAAAAFLCFINAALFDMRFLVDIWGAQAPERERAAREEAEEQRRREERFEQALRDLRERQRRERTDHSEETPVPGQTNDLATTNDTTTPAPAANPSPPAINTSTTPVFMPSDQEGLVDVAPTATQAQTTTPQSSFQAFGAIYTRFYLIILATLFLSINAMTWPIHLRKPYFLLLSLLTLSLWTPQIYRNVSRNSRRALTYEFVVSSSLLRLAPHAYLYAIDPIFLFPDPDPRALALLIAHLWLQIALLASQDLLGPRWFVRPGWFPPAYDYHPILRSDDHDPEAASLPLGFSPVTTTTTKTTTSPHHASNSKPTSPTTTTKTGPQTRSFTCAICMQDLEVAILPSSSSLASTSAAPESTSTSSSSSTALLLARRAYMVTPCRHIFHTACLEGWIKFRLQCPICREGLPAL